MSIQDLGSLGELIAAIATLVTLLYLAMQIRHNTRALDQSTGRAIADDATRWRESVIHRPEVADLYLKGMFEPDSLNPSEKLRFRMLLHQLFYHWQYQHDSGLAPLDAHPEDLSGALATPGGASYWKKSKHRFSSGFVSYVEESAQAGFESDTE